jgi:two-component system, chemotaxis family, protein-glutamate methylesterase/glutaminase
MEKDTLKGKPILLIGGSAGSLEVLIKTLPLLRPVCSFSIIIVVHRKNTDDSLLEDLLAAKTVLPVGESEDKAPLLPGYIYIAPADYHVLFEHNGEMALDVSEKVNYSRPSIDVSFQSAAETYGSGVTAILLSGANADGTDGLSAVQHAGGTIVVQQPDTAEMPYMPQYALNHLVPDALITPGNLADYINQLSARLDF